MKLNLIYSETTDNIIGVNNDLFCKIKSDLKMFQTITSTKVNGSQNVVIMGSNTWKSIGKPLPNRTTVVITSENIDNDDILTFKNINECFENIQRLNYGSVFIIGGSKLFLTIIRDYYDLIDIIYQTKINHLINHHDIPSSLQITYNKIVINDDFKLLKSKDKNEIGMIHNMKDKYIQSEINYTENVFQKVKNINLQEYQYLNTLQDILQKNTMKVSRNGNVYSDFGVRMKFDLRNGFPLLTTKKMPWKTILRELIWFINGSTDNKLLQDNNVHIWDGNGSKDFLESRGLSNEEGDLGPIYGFQWRHFGAEYINHKTDYTGKGVDQLQWIIDEIKSNPTSRRLVMSAWNPIDIDKMALPPCHVMVQFNIEDNYIDAQLYQRSGDMFLGVPFNISSYSFLLHIIGKLTGYIPRYLIHIIGDAHIYEEHTSAINEQLLRIPHPFPKLSIDSIDSIDSINENKFKLNNYNYYTPIKGKMIV